MTSTKDILARLAPADERSVPVTSHSPSPASGPGPDQQEGSAEAKPKDEPWGVAQVVTPSGLEIYFQAGPKRLYRLRDADDELASPWTEVVSPTTALDVLHKAALTWWGMTTGAAGVLKLVKEGKMTIVDSTEVEDVVASLTKNKLTVNHTLEEAGNRGTSVHKALELWCEKGIMPNPEAYPADEEGYVRGLLAFLKDTDVMVIESELMVGSIAHKYAGRLDFIGTFPTNAKAVVKSWAKWKPKYWDLLPGRRELIDLKTSKYVYGTNFMQLEAYEQALQESGYDRTAARWVLHVFPDGRYELVPNHHWDSQKKAYDTRTQRAFLQDFLDVLTVYHVVERIG